MKDKREQYMRIVDTLLETYTAKNKDYGDSFKKSLEEFGPISFVVRASDKMERLKQLVNNAANVGGETTTDTVADLANYCIMYLMEVEK